MSDDEHLERCLECEQEITEKILSAEEFFLNISAYRQVNLTTHGIRIGSAVYCLHCWTFQQKDPEQKPLQREVSADVLRAQWGELNQRSRWYTQQTWQGPFAFITVASIAAYNLIREVGVPVETKAIGFFLLSAFGIAVARFLNYVGQGIDKSVRQMMRIELHPAFLRTSSLEGTHDPSGFLEPSLVRLRKHRALVQFVVWIYTFFFAITFVRYSVQLFQ